MFMKSQVHTQPSIFILKAEAKSWYSTEEFTQVRYSIASIPCGSSTVIYRKCVIEKTHCYRGGKLHFQMRRPLKHVRDTAVRDAGA